VWAADITYLATFAGPLYLAVVLDLYARRIVGWTVAAHMRDELVLEALDAAVRSRRPPRGLIHHSDRGSQYASDAYLAALERQRMIASMSRKGDCWDNAPVESFFATLKTELGSTFTGLEHAVAALTEYIAFYNLDRLHSTLGYLSPTDHELNPNPAARAA
jgi:transposase InsO family protein